MNREARVVEVYGCPKLTAGRPLVERNTIESLVRGGIIKRATPAFGKGKTLFEHAYYYGGEYLGPKLGRPTYIRGDQEGNWLIYGPFDKTTAGKRKNALFHIHKYLWEEMKGGVVRITLGLNPTKKKAYMVSSRGWYDIPPNLSGCFHKRILDGRYVIMGKKTGEFECMTEEKVGRIVNRAQLQPIKAHDWETEELLREARSRYDYCYASVSSTLIAGSGGIWVCFGPMREDEAIVHEVLHEKKTAGKENARGNVQHDDNELEKRCWAMIYNELEEKIGEELGWIEFNAKGGVLQTIGWK